MCQTSLNWLREGDASLESPLKENGFHSSFLFHLVPNSLPFLSLPPTHSQKNGSRTVGFFLQQLTCASNDGLRYILHLLTTAGYVSNVCLLKEGQEWWLLMSFGINFPEPKTVCLMSPEIVLFFSLQAQLWLQIRMISHLTGPNLSPKWISEESKGFAKDGARKGRLPNRAHAYSHPASS